MAFVVMAITQRWPRRLSLRGAAVAAALAAATKYQSALLLLPIALAAYQTRPRLLSRKLFVRELAGLFGVFALVFVLLTPAVYLDAGRFFSWVTLMRDWYKNGGHPGYDVVPGLPHLWKILVYLGGDYFSFMLPVALLVSAFAVCGIVGMVRESRQRAAVFFLFPALYIPYMCSQKVFIVRNMLIVGPFLAIAAARGVRVVQGCLRARAARLSLLAMVTLAVVANTIWLGRAALSIPRSTPELALRISLTTSQLSR